MQPAPIGKPNPQNKNLIVGLTVLFSVAIICCIGFSLASRAAIDENVIGLWSTEGPSGDLVDPYSGNVTGSIYNGEWYLFRRDGTYRYVIISSGQILNGGVVCEGKFTTKNGILLLTNIKESWCPNPEASWQKEAYENKRVADLAVVYELGDDGKTLIINTTDYFSKVEE
jgi:hypothetical protein